MNQSTQLAGRFREVMLHGKWVANTNLKELLSNVTAAQANRQVGGLNTIAALTFHINYYIAGVLNVFKGGSLDIRDKYSFDVPDLTSEGAWQGLLEELWANAEAFAAHVEQMTTEDLEATFVDKKYGSYQRNIEGMIEHSYYHLGQIRLLKKLLDN